VNEASGANLSEKTHSQGKEKSKRRTWQKLNLEKGRGGDVGRKLISSHGRKRDSYYEGKRHLGVTGEKTMHKNTQRELPRVLPPGLIREWLDKEKRRRTVNPEASENKKVSL